MKKWGIILLLKKEDIILKSEACVYDCVIDLNKDLRFKYNKKFYTLKNKKQKILLFRFDHRTEHSYSDEDFENIIYFLFNHFDQIDNNEEIQFNFCRTNVRLMSVVEEQFRKSDLYPICLLGLSDDKIYTNIISNFHSICFKFGKMYSKF